MSSGGLWSKLRERKVPRTVGIYLGASWAALQFGDLVVDIWQIPFWTVQVWFVVLLLGVPLAGVLAWKYDVTSDGIVRAAGPEHRAGTQADAGLPLWQKFLLLCALLVALLGSLHLWPDAYVDPRISHLLATPVTADEDPLNAALLIYGLNAPAGRDPYEYGRYITDTYESIGRIPAIADRLEFTVDSADRVSLRQAGNTERMFASVASIPAILDANAELLARYKLLRRDPVFTEVIRPAFASPVVPVEDLVIAQYLVRLEIVHAAETGAVGTAWELWREEMTMLRKVLASSNHLLMKSITKRLASEMVRLRVLLLAHGHRDETGAPVARLSPAERSMVAPLRFEITSVINTIQGARNRFDLLDPNAGAGKRFLAAILPFRQNATINFEAYYLDFMEASLLDTRQFIEWEKAWQPPAATWLDYINNGAGLVLGGFEAIDSFAEYIYFQHDLDRIILLSHVAERLLQEGIAGADANGWLQSLPAEYRDPFTGERPTWRDGELAYPGLDLEFEEERALDLPLP